MFPTALEMAQLWLPGLCSAGGRPGGSKAALRPGALGWAPSSPALVTGLSEPRLPSGVAAAVRVGPGGLVVNSEQHHLCCNPSIITANPGAGRSADGDGEMRLCKRCVGHQRRPMGPLLLKAERADAGPPTSSPRDQ